MSFCTKCGSEIEENSNFCPNCGASVGSSKNQEHNRNFNIDFKKIAEVFENMIVKPITSIRKIPKEISKSSTITISIILTALVGVISILFRKVMLMTFMRVISNIFSDRIGGFYSGIREMTFRNMGIKRLTNFFMSSFSFILLLGMIFLVFYITKYIIKSKEKSNALVLWNVIICSSIPFVAVYLIALIISLISFTAFIAIFFVGVILSFIILYEGVNTFSNRLNKNIYYFTGTLSAVIVIVQKILVSMMK